MSLDQSIPFQFAVLPVLVRGFAWACALGAGVARTLPQGSEDTLASGIFLSDSL